MRRSKGRTGPARSKAVSRPMAVGAPVNDSPELVEQASVVAAAGYRARARQLLAKTKTAFLDITFEKAGNVAVVADLIIGTYVVPVGAVAVIDRLALFCAEPFGYSDIDFKLLVSGGECPSTLNFGSLGVFGSGSPTEPMTVGPVYAQASETIQVMASSPPGFVVNFTYQCRVLVRLSGSLSFPGALAG